MSIRGIGPVLDLQLQAQYQERSGIELLLNGTFNGSTGWTATAQVTFVNNTAVIVAGGVSNSFSETAGTMTIGRRFSIRIRVSSLTAGTVRVYAGSGTAGTLISAAGDYTEELVCAGDTKLYVLYSAACQATVSFLSVQEVLQKTADDSDYCDTVAYLLSNRGGAQECASLVKLEHVDRHTGLVTTVADFSTSPGAGAVYTLPTGWTYTCASGSRTTQTSLATIKTGINANEFPARSVDGVNFGGSVEKAATNLITRSNEFLLGLWTSGAGMTVSAVGDTTGPDGTASATRLTPGGIGSYLAVSFAGTAGVTYTFSYWVENNSANQLRAIAYSAALGVNIVVVDLTASMVVGAWRRVSITFTVPVGGTGVIYVYPHVQGIAPAGYLWIYGAQVEVGLHPTSYIPTAAAAVTRAAATLTVLQDTANQFSGLIPRLTLRPHYAYNEAVYDASVDDDSRSRAFYEVSSQRWPYEVYGRGRIQSLQCTWSRDQAITVRGDLDEATGLMTLIVSGCTTGNGTYQSYAAPKKAVVCGDGYTAAGFSTQRVPRGDTFDGGDYLNAGAVGNDLTDNFTLWAAINPNDLSKFAAGFALRLFARRGATTQFDYYLDGASGLQSMYDGSSIRQAASDLRGRGFVTVAAVVSGASVQFYTNGRPDGVSAAVAIVERVTNLLVGSYSPPVLGPYYGILFGAKVYRYALAPTQLRDLHEQALLEANR